MGALTSVIHPIVDQLIAIRGSNISLLHYFRGHVIASGTGTDMGNAMAETALMTAKKPVRKRGGVRRAPALDGLRGFAVLAVVIYHFFGDVIPGGYLGVDVFFVLSGFLITSLLIREKVTTGRVDLKDFWLRRFRRIVPAALVVLVVGTAAASLVGGDPAVGLGLQFLGTLLFANNWFQIADSQSYFADSGVQIFAHYWSLSVEEQFYVVWPLLFVVLLAVLARRGYTNGSGRAMASVSFGLAALSFYWMLVNFDENLDPTRVYYGTDTHAFGLLIGAGLAFVLTTASNSADTDSWPADRGPLKSRVSMTLVGVAAFFGLLFLVFTMGDTAPVTYRGGLLAASILTAIVLLVCVRGDNALARLFGTRPMRWLGERSFSLYLWHWPVVVIVVELLGRTELPDTVMISGVIAMVISLPLSSWSYKWIETPIRRKGYKEIFSDLAGPQAPALRRFTTFTLPLTLLIICSWGIVTGPQETELQRQLNAIEVEQAAEQADSLDNLGRELPTGDQITVIGDSVTMMAQEALAERFPGVYTDGEVNRHYIAAEQIIVSMETAGTLDPFVVLGFGTNGPAAGYGDPTLLDRLIEQIGDDRVIILVNPWGDEMHIPDAVEEVGDAAKTYDNVYVADWCGTAAANSWALYPDGVHPTPDGASTYVDAIEAALQQWVDGDKEIPATRVCIRP